VRQWFVDNDLIEGVIYLPENLFYNTTAPGIILVLNKAKAVGGMGHSAYNPATNGRGNNHNQHG